MLRDGGFGTKWYEHPSVEVVFSGNRISPAAIAAWDRKVSQDIKTNPAIPPDNAP